MISSMFRSVGVFLQHLLLWLFVLLISVMKINLFTMVDDLRIQSHGCILTWSGRVMGTWLGWTMMAAVLSLKRLLIWGEFAFWECDDPMAFDRYLWLLLEHRGDVLTAVWYWVSLTWVAHPFISQVEPILILNTIGEGVFQCRVHCWLAASKLWNRPIIEKVDGIRMILSLTLLRKF